MTAKRYRPALYELVNKGPLKPTDQGTLKTPKWFYPKQKETYQQRQERLDRIRPLNKAGSEPLVARSGLFADVPPKDAPEAATASEAPSTADDGTPRQAVTSSRAIPPHVGTRAVSVLRHSFSARLRQVAGKLSTNGSLVSGLWAKPQLMMVLGAILIIGVLVGSYRIGRSLNTAEQPPSPTAPTTLVDSPGGGETGPAVSTDASIGRAIASIPASRSGYGATDSSNNRSVNRGNATAQGPYRSSTGNRSQRPSGSPSAVATASTGAALRNQSGGSPRAQSPAPIPQEGNCLILCSHNSSRDLRDVQEFFTRNGIRTTIGRFQGRYVLHSNAVFERQSSVEAAALKRAVSELGERYNDEKPRGAAVFTPSTFRSAYWARIESIR